MNTKDRFINHYEKGYMPWDHTKPDFNLVDTIQNQNIKPCKTLEIGCGTGSDSIWLASQGFNVCAVDVSPIAINMAIEKAKEATVKCQFLVKDFLNDTIPDPPYSFVFDRGYFHSFKTNGRRKKIAKYIAYYLADDGLWLSLIGNCDSPPRDSGPPARSAKDIIRATEPFFELQFLKTSVFGNEQNNPAKNWVCLLKKRSL